MAVPSGFHNIANPYHPSPHGTAGSASHLASAPNAINQLPSAVLLGSASGSRVATPLSHGTPANLALPYRPPRTPSEASYSGSPFDAGIAWRNRTGSCDTDSMSNSWGASLQMDAEEALFDATAASSRSETPLLPPQPSFHNPSLGTLDICSLPEEEIRRHPWVQGLLQTLHSTPNQQQLILMVPTLDKNIIEKHPYVQQLQRHIVDLSLSQREAQQSATSPTISTICAAPGIVSTTQPTQQPRRPTRVITHPYQIDPLRQCSYRLTPSVPSATPKHYDAMFWHKSTLHDTFKILNKTMFTIDLKPLIRVIDPKTNLPVPMQESLFNSCRDESREIVEKCFAHLPDKPCAFKYKTYAYMSKAYPEVWKQAMDQVDEIWPELLYCTNRWKTTAVVGQALRYFEWENSLHDQTLPPHAIPTTPRNPQGIDQATRNAADAAIESALNGAGPPSSVASLSSRQSLLGSLLQPSASVHASAATSAAMMGEHDTAPNPSVSLSRDPEEPAQPFVASDAVAGMTMGPPPNPRATGSTAAGADTVTPAEATQAVSSSSASTQPGAEQAAMHTSGSGSAEEPTGEEGQMETHPREELQQAEPTAQDLAADAAECDDLLQAIKRLGMAYLLTLRKALTDTNRHKRENNLRIDLIREHRRSPFTAQELRDADTLAKEVQKQERQAKRAANSQAVEGTRTSKRPKRAGASTHGDTGHAAAE
ncbi:hypothetical protein OC842_003771 [Tilletia horrida]|uniref:Uncharacterized protein n=1 Tax=Tilletia horrida TaxID=155126 RepID=A0AAN6GB31_9BASI|nr:hypothetical protein OC842_003771 [Tilletia horrida]